MKPNWKKDYLRRKAYFLNMVSQYKQRTDIKAYLEILLSLSTVCVLGIFALRPTLITIAKLTKEIEAKRETIKKMDEKIQNLKTAQSLYNQEKENINLLETSIPNNPQPDIFVRQVEGLSGKNQVAVSRMSIGKASILGKAAAEDSQVSQTKPMPSGTIGINFSVTTALNPEQYSLLYNFLTDFENLRRPARIDRITFNLESRTGDSKILLMSITGKLPHFVGDDKEAGR